MELLVLPVLILMSMGIAWVFEGDSSDTSGDDPTGDEDDGPITTTRLTDDDDIFEGTDGRDAIFANGGDDQIAGGAGDDRIFLDDGDDQNFLTVDGEAQLHSETVAGDDLIRGGAGSDLIVDFLGANTLHGDTGGDVLDAIDQAGSPLAADTLFGGYGDDFLAGDAGDTMTGGEGRDAFFVSLGAGGGPVPTITDYAPDERIAVSVPLAFQDSMLTLDVRDGGTDVSLDGNPLLRLEGVTDPSSVQISLQAADFADQTVTPGTLTLGSDGDDTLTTGAGDDAIFAGRGADEISTGDGDDYISLRGARPFEAEGELGWGSNTVIAGEGADRVIGGQSDDRIDGNGGRDLLISGGGSDVIRGGGGDDRIDGLDGDTSDPDTLLGGAGDDMILADDGDQVTLGDGQDTVMVRDGGEPVTITDFTPGTDRLELDALPEDVTLIATSDGTAVRIAGQNVAILQGLRPDQIRAGDIGAVS